MSGSYAILLLTMVRFLIFFSHISAAISLWSLPAAHHEEVCDYYEQRRERYLAPIISQFHPVLQMLSYLHHRIVHQSA